MAGHGKRSRDATAKIYVSSALSRSPLQRLGSFWRHPGPLDDHRLGPFRDGDSDVAGEGANDQHGTVPAPRVARRCNLRGIAPFETAEAVHEGRAGLDVSKT